MQKLTTKSHAETIAEQLSALRPDVVSEDRKAFASRFNTSEGTISLYLNGDVRNVSLGLSMLDFMKKRIAKRQLTIERLTK